MLNKVRSRRTQCDDDEHHQEIDEPMFELVVAHSRCYNRASEARRYAHADTTNHAANHDIPEHTFFAVPTDKSRDEYQLAE